jgi:hypothetical protein
MAGVSTATLYAYFPSKAELFKVVDPGNRARHRRPGARERPRQGRRRARLLALATPMPPSSRAPLTRAIFRMVTAERRRFEAVADYFLQSARDELGGRRSR